MKFRRTVAGFLAALTLFQSGAVFAHDDHHHGTHHQEGPVEHTITITADAIPGSFTALSNTSTNMVDHGDVLSNADGVANVEIQGTYHRNQTLATVSLDGTSFSFAPIMAEDYYPNPVESPEPSESPESSETPETPETPEPTETVDNNETPAPSENPGESALPENTQSTAPDEETTPEPEHTPAPTAQETPEVTETATPTPTAKPTPAITDSPVPTEIPADDPQEEANAFLRWLFPAAYAEGSSGAPSKIVGQRISSYRTGGCSTIVYSGLFDSNTDVYLSALTNGVKENICVHEYTGNHSFEYVLRTEGLTARLSGKEIHLYDANGNLRARIDAPNMTDDNGNYSTDIDVELRGSGAEYRVVYTPNDEWMANAAYPVMIDPTGKFENQLATGIGDAYVSSSSPDVHFAHSANGSEQKDHNRTETNLYAGKKGGSTYYSYIIPSLRGFETDGLGSGFPNTDLLVTSATWKVYVHEVSGSGNFTLSLVTGNWNTATVTYNSRPSHSSVITVPVKLKAGWNSIDVTKIFSAWFNALDQKQNYGLVVSSSDSYARICASDILPMSDRMSFTASYYTGIQKPVITAKSSGYGVNSESGWVDLSWKKVTGADGYVLGIYNGKKYEYQFLGNVTSFSTKGKKLWPTAEELAAGKTALHWDGTGRELPNIPNASQTDLNYYFCVFPANRYGQVASSKTAGEVAVTLPDTTPPSIPATVSVSPAGYSNADTRSVTWAGVTDLPSGSSSLGSKGKIQYVINPEGADSSVWAWQNTTSNSANGSFDVPVTELEDGTHAVYIRGVDNAGNWGQPMGATIKVDKTAPSAPEVTLLPGDWTDENTASLTWTGIADVNDLLRVEYALDGGNYISTEIAEKSYTGYPLDISTLEDGQHTLSIRGVDLAGNLGIPTEVSIKIDRSAPQLVASGVNPSSWADAASAELFWQGAEDLYSGLAAVEYSVNGEAFAPAEVTMDGSQNIDISALADGQHSITLRLTDALGNSSDYTHNLFVDTSAPVTALVSPQDGDIVTGVLDIWGSVQDISLKEWTLSAVDSTGKMVEIASGTQECVRAQLGVLNTQEFADGETIEIILRAVDAAGHESVSRGLFIKADHSAKPVTAGVSIIAPTQSQTFTVANSQMEYTLEYEGGEAAGTVVSDGVPSGKANRYTYPLYPILYPENSVHSLSVISESKNGQLHYSKGMASTLILSDIWKDAANLESVSNISTSEAGALLTADSGSFLSVTFKADRPVLALRLHTLEKLAEGGSITYECSVDNGTTWQPIREGYDVLLDSPQTSVKLRVNMTGSGTLLQGLDLSGVYELNPLRYSMKLLKPVTSFKITNQTENTKALLPITTDSGASFTATRLYADGVWNSNRLTADMLPFADGTLHRFTAFGVDENGTLHGSGAASHILLRTAPDAEDEYLSGKIALPGQVYALRLEALCMTESGKVSTKGRFAYSLDGTTWTDFATGEYVFLPKTADSLYFRATLPGGVILRAVHLEGVTASTTPLSTVLVKAPYHVQAADYGDYYENEKLRRYVLTWSDPNRDDETCESEVWFDVYRNGELIGSTRSTRYEDYDYQENASYQVAARRVYQNPDETLTRILTRRSGKVSAEYVYIPAEQRLEGVQHNVADFTQSEYLNDLYGGNYTFSDTANPPSLEVALDQSLLGPHRFCSLGFEPINFNTGNFFLQTRDYSLADLGTGGFDIVRTYNTQSNEEDGPFGAKWASDYSMHLRLFGDGSVALRRGDGSEIIFYRQQDGSFTSNTTEYENLSYDDAGTEYRITLTDGTVYVFASGGLLSRIEKDGGQHILQILRNEDGFITSILSPSHEELKVQMDENGHITSIVTPGGAELTYTYKNNLLVSFTDAEGNTTKYKYDNQGRMTQWTDAAGKCQVRNKYDDQSRVIYQEDALGGKYHLEYAEDHTITTDAEGNRVTYYFDQWKHTTRIVDARGGETTFTYGENSEIVSETDPMGNVTTYAYNSAGDLTATVLPSGGSILREYDDRHNLTRLTDLSGGVTTYEYDENSNLIAETAPNGAITRYEYDQKGRLVAQTDALGNVTRYEYVNGLLTKTVDPLGNETAYRYDAHGFLASATDALGNTTLYTHDAKGNLLCLTFADGTSVTYTYDAMGRQTSMTDPMGNTTTYQYDALGNLIKTRLPDGTVQTATYTKNYQLASTRDGMGNETHYTYDPGGNQITLTDPMGNVTTSEYNPAGNLVRETSPTGGVTTYTYDALGFPLSVTDAAGLTQTMTYDLAGNMLARTLPGGGVISAEYDQMGNVIRQTNALGGVTTIQYDLLGRITSVTDPAGAVTAYTYDANGNLLTVTDGLGNVTAYRYDALNRLVSETAPNGATTRYTYDSVGNLVATTDALGNVTTYTYDLNGNLVSMTDALGQTVSLEYDKNGNATAAIQKNGGVIATGYDKSGRIISETDTNQNTTKYRYDKNGQVTQITDAMGQKATFEYDALGNITKITAPGKAVTLYEYDAAGRALSSTDAEGCVTLYGYNENGQIATLTVNGNATSYEYDLAGNITAVTDAEGRRVEFTYDLSGNLVQITYPDGTAETTEYDLLGRVVRITPRTGLTTAYTYDSLGNVTSVAQGQQVTRYEYDLLGRLTKVITPDGAETAYAYDALGNIIGETDPLGNTTRFAYTPENLLAQVTYANGATQSLSYDLAGNVTAETDGEGYTKHYKYDKVNRLTAVVDEAGNTTSYKYDALDNIAQVTDAMKHVTKYTYDKNGNLLTETDALGNTVTYTYTPEGWLSSVTKADGTVMTFAYDKTGNLLVQNTGENQSIENSYNEVGQVTTVKNSEGTIKYQYNQQGYLVSVTNVNGDEVSYTYDEYGNKTSMTYPDGRAVRYTYDSMSRMTSVTGLDGEVTTYAYDAAGRRVETSSRNLTTEYTYDAVGNLSRQKTTGSSNIHFQYTYNLNGYITGEVRTENGAAVESLYTYDPLGELTGFTQSTGYGEQYAYDKAGNMTAKTITGTDGQTVALKMTYNKGNQLVTMTNGKDKLTYGYDKNGSMVQKVLSSKQYGKLTDTYAYNSLDQLVSYTGYDGYQQRFTYDANGMRLSKSEYGNSDRSTLEELLRGNIAGLPEVIQPAEEVPEGYEWATTEYLYDITQEYYQVIEQTTTKDNTTTTTAYAYGVERIAAYDTNATTQYIYDGRGSVAQTISAPAAGTSVSAALPQVEGRSYSYTAFGEQMGTEKIPGFAYNAEDYDAGTGMINLRMRQYEPAVGRFSQKDIIRGQVTSSLTQNRYAYCSNNPKNYIDPSGRSAENQNLVKIQQIGTNLVSALPFGSNQTSVIIADCQVDMRNKGSHEKHEKMPLNYLASAQGQMIGRYVYAGDQIPDATAKPPKVECVGIARLPAISWFTPSAYRELNIQTKASSTYDNATYKGKLTSETEMFNGMQLFTESKSHVVTYWESVYIDGIYYENVVVESNGRKYGYKGMSNEEIDKYNKEKKVTIKPYEEEEGKYVFWCALDYVDYGDAFNFESWEK